jgi:outer membrane protein assembly factor BamA
MQKKYLVLILTFVLQISVFAQKDTINVEKIKKGWTFGAMPAIAYNSDIGMRYGGVVNFFNFGDGTTYPDYHHSIYLEWTRTTKGNGRNILRFDSKKLIPKVRTSFTISYLTEKALNFYGFNGYEALYNRKFINVNSDEYISRMYYSLEQKNFQFSLDFQGKLFADNLFWVAGIGHNTNDIGTVDIAEFNKGKDPEEMLPDRNLLYDDYVEWGIIPEEQKNGGNINLLKLGMVYDTRDNEPNPMSGMWTEAFLLASPSLLESDYAYTKLCITHRQYFTLIKKRLNFAYRLGYQGKIAGEMPFYMLPYIYSSNKPTVNGLGGSKTLRGLLRNRVVGEDFLFGNMEFRWKFLRTVVFNQNLYIALSAFTDFGYITDKYEYPNPQNIDLIEDKDGLHSTYGGGLHFALNENFIVAVDYGLAKDRRDGKKGLYIGLNFLY